MTDIELSDTAYECEVEWDEDGLHLIVHADETYNFKVLDPEQLHDRAKSEIGPWLYEMYQAKAEYDRNTRAGLTLGRDASGATIWEYPDGEE